MIKLLLCLSCSFALGAAMLQLRQQQTELRHQSARLQRQIEGMQARIWAQQLQIALATSPPALADSLLGSELSLIPDPRLPEPAGNWITAPPKR